MKKLLIVLLLILFTVSCGSKKDISVKLGYIGEIDKSIWEYVQNQLKAENIILELIQFSDYSVLNKALENDNIDLNHFQNYAYFVNETNKNDYYLSIIARTFIASMNMYSRNLNDLSQLKIHSKIAVPNDYVNLSRALKILESIGLIKLKKSTYEGYNFTLNDIVENYLQLEIIPVEASNLYSFISSADAVLVNLNLNFDFKNENVLYYDDPKKYDSDMYINIIAARLEDSNNGAYKVVSDYYKNRIKEFVDAGKLPGIIIDY